MKDEIKEIKIGMYTTGEILEFMTNGEGRNFMGRSMYDAIIDYITNLQEENEYSNHCNEELRKKITNLEYKIERQKEELNEQYKQRNKFKKKYSYLKVAKEDYKSRNEKIINKISLYRMDDITMETNRILDDLLNTARGVDKE